jgi:hypothetical protein
MIVERIECQLTKKQPNCRAPGTLTPGVFRGLRLTINSDLMARCTGRSVGLARVLIQHCCPN